jgi:diguanylate cyclase (GGDEF)-like protein
MKLSPTISTWIRQLILKNGVGGSSVLVTFLSVLLSVFIAKLVAVLLPGSSGRFNITIAVIVPLLIAPLLSYVFMSMYFELERIRAEVHMLAITDELTHVYNRRHFVKLAEHELERAKRYRHHLSIIIFDIDDFKKVNDHYGHLCGDAVLQGLSLACKSILRQCDVFARFGGEEFILLLPETDEAGAMHVANRLLQLIGNHAVEYQDLEIPITVSVGVTTNDPDGDTLDDLLNRADRAMYQAKRLGKNRLEIA